MIKGTAGVARVLVDVLLLVPLVCIGIIGYWFVENIFFGSTEIVNPRADKTDYVAGDIISMEFDVIRYRDCKIEISRLMERTIDRREFQVQFLTQLIERDYPPFRRTWGYRIAIPVELGTGDYDVYSRVRYYCNGLDYIYPRYYITAKVRVHVDGLM